MRRADPLDAPAVSQRELEQSMPPSVREALPPWGWTVERLWAVERPARQVRVEEFDWLLDVPVWRWNGTRFQVSLRQVLRAPDVYAAHVDKAVASDGRRPINVTMHRGKLVILDGYHRLLKVLLEDGNTIQVIEVHANDFD